MLNFCGFIQVCVFTTNHHLKFQGDMLNFCDFIQVYVFTTNHHLKIQSILNISKPEFILNY